VKTKATFAFSQLHPSLSLPLPLACLLFFSLSNPKKLSITPAHPPTTTPPTHPPIRATQSFTLASTWIVAYVSLPVCSAANASLSACVSLAFCCRASSNCCDFAAACCCNSKMEGSLPDSLSCCDLICKSMKNKIKRC